MTIYTPIEKQTDRVWATDGQFLETAMALVPVNAICKQWQVSKALVYLWISERRFPHYRVGGRGKRGKVLIEEDEFKSFLESCRVDEGELAEDGELRHIV